MKFVEVTPSHFINLESIKEVIFTSVIVATNPPMPDAPKTRENVSADVIFRDGNGQAVRFEGDGAKKLRAAIQAAR